MRFTKSLIIAAMAFLSSVGMKAQCCGSSCAEAQELGYKPYPYWFVQVQGGVSKVFSPESKFNPTYSLGIGRMFSPIVGARLHFNGYETKNGLASVPGQNYKFKYLTSDADVLVNILNIFSKKVHRPVDVYLVAGLGLSYAWDNKDFGALAPKEDISNAWGPTQSPRHSLLSHNLRAGIAVDYNFAKHWSVGIEADVNSLDDRFNSKFKNADDWMMTAQLSVTYKFGFKKPCKPAEPVVVPVAKPEPVAAPVPVKEVKNPIKETIFYEIRANEPNPEHVINNVAAWAKKYPDGKISVSGYADKGTGNPKINMGYSEKRANAVTKLLLEKGVPASMITTNAYGDTVQPFAENDRNRCVIIIGDFK